MLTSIDKGGGQAIVLYVDYAANSADSTEFFNLSSDSNADSFELRNLSLDSTDSTSGSTDSTIEY